MSRDDSQTSSNPDEAAEGAEPAASAYTCRDPHDPSQPCRICGGYGFIRLDVPMTDARWGKLHRCPNNPPQYDLERQARLRKLSNLDGLADRTFERFVTDRRGYTPQERSSLEQAWRRSQAYAQNPQGWLVLLGSYGCGKTHLAAAIGNVRLAQGDHVIFLTTPDLLDHLRSTYRPNSDMDYDEVFERLRNVSLLILDDLGVENPSEWAQEKLYQLLNHRYAHKKATVITSNVDLEKLDPRVASRMRDQRLVSTISIDAPDFRDSARLRGLARYSRLDLYRHMTFDSFDTHTALASEHHENLKKALRRAQEFATDPQGWLLFIGEHGTGKTHLAAACALEISYGQRREVLFVDVQQLMSDLRATFDSQSLVKFDELFDMVRSVEVLVLDDVPPENSKTTWTHEKLFQLLEHRYLSNNPTILTTATTLEEMPLRLRSRLLDSRVCLNQAITAPPYALRIKHSR